jgi:ribonuclease HI
MSNNADEVILLLLYNKEMIIFTDGSARGNPGPGGWGAIILTDDTAKEMGGGEKHTTNNRMELTAVISALATIKESHITLYTDSAYVVSGITRWVFGWIKNEWITSKKEEVLNRDLWESLVEVVRGKNIDWKLIKGHSGNSGNERCDVIATSFADEKNIVLYNGSRSRYGVDISANNFSGTDSSSKKSKSKTKAHSYVSLVNGEIKVYKTWDECKARVNGVAGAKYKKSTSPENEEEIIKEFLSN